MKLPIILVPHPHIRQDQTVLGGSPYVVGSRVPVRRLYGFFRRGVTVERILRRYPQLGPAKVLDALAFALDNPEVIEADIEREESILKKAGHKPAGGPSGGRQMALPFEGEAPAAPRSSRPPRRPGG